jgi:PAS domain S-box-containing protein
MLKFRSDGNNRLKIIFLLAIAVLVVLWLMSYFRINQLTVDCQSVSHAHEVTLELHKLLSTIQEIESSQRGYVLTKDVKFLPVINNAGNLLDHRLTIIAKLSKDNPKQKDKVIKLRAIAFKKLNFIQRIIEDSKKSKLSDARFIEGKEIMDELMIQLNTIINEENKLIHLHSNSFTKSITLIPYYHLILIFSAILILLASYFKIIQELNKSIKLNLNIGQCKIELEKSNIILKSKIQEIDKRESDLVIANKELQFQNDEKDKRASEMVIANLNLSRSEILLKNSLKEVSDYKEALDETAIIGITDQKGIIKKVNSNFCKISKYNESELLGQDHRILNSGYHSKEFIAEMWQTITKGKKWRGELKNKAKDGTYYWVDTTIVPFMNEKEKPYQYLAIRVDITKRKESEDKLISTNKELELFNYISSHDLQAPLRHIQNFASRIMDDESQNLSEKGKTYFEKINSSANRMQNLLKDLLNYSKTSMEERLFETTKLNDIINNVISEFREIIDEKHATIDIDDIGEADVIPFQFHQLLYNLIGNALNFSKHNIPPHIHIKQNTVTAQDIQDIILKPKTRYCHISISDNGIGFDPQYNERIFGLFQRLDHEQKVSGTGIGLAIVKKIVENHYGNITAKGKLFVGATFDIYIPLTQKNNDVYDK